MRPMKRPSDDFEHYAYVVLYINGVLSVSDDPTKVLQKINKYFGLKPGSLSNLNIYLDTKLKPMRMENWVVACSLSPSQYIQEDVKSMDRYVKGNNGDWWKIPMTAVKILPCGYEPPLDVSQELDPVLSSYYQYHIGIIRRMVKLGRIDINTEV